MEQDQEKKSTSVIRKILPWVFFLCLATVLVGSLVLRIFNTPLAPKLEVTEAAPQPAATEVTPVVDSASEVLPTTTSGTCGGKGALTILVVGESYPVKNYMRGADAVRLVQVNFDTGAVRITAFPPVLWVNTSQIPLLQSNNSTLTAAYYLAKQPGNDSERNKMAYASNVVAQTLADNFSISTDNYISLKQETFKEIIDTMGGLTMSFPTAVTNPKDGVVIFPSGQQVLSGQQALDYSRFITDNPALVSEWNRFDRQNQILVAIIQEILSVESVSNAPGLVKNFYDDVVTDLSVSQLLDLACVMKNSNMKNFQYVEFKRDLIASEQNNILIPDNNAVTQYYQSFYNP